MCAIAGAATVVTTATTTGPPWWLQAPYLDHMKELVAKGYPALAPFNPVAPPPPEIDWLAINREIAGT